MEKTKSSKLIYSGKIISVYKDEVLLDNGVLANREIVKHQRGVSIAIKDSDGLFYMVKQYRYAFKKDMIEFCAGKVEDDENVDEAVIRECKEELGVEPINVKKLGVMIPTCGFCTEELHLYYGEVGNIIKQNLDEDEELTIHKFSLKEINDMIESGKIDDSKTIATMYYLNKGNK